MHVSNVAGREDPDAELKEKQGLFQGQKGKKKNAAEQDIKNLHCEKQSKTKL